MTAMNKLPVLGFLCALLMSAPAFAFADVLFPFVNIGTAHIGRIPTLNLFSLSIPFSRRDTSSGVNANSGGNTTDTTQGQNAAGVAPSGNTANNGAGNNNGGATAGNGGNGGQAQNGGTVRSGDTTSIGSAFNSMNNTVLIIRLGR